MRKIQNLCRYDFGKGKNILITFPQNSQCFLKITMYILIKEYKIASSTVVLAFNIGRAG